MKAKLSMAAMASGMVQQALATAMLGLAIGGALAVQASAPDAAHGGEAAAKHAPKTNPRPPQGSGIDGRVQLLARELDLDAGQQIGVRKILERQRADVSQVWSNEAMPAQLRVASTRAIGERTADNIRAILNDKQRARYNKAQPAAATAKSTPSGDAWSNVLGGH
jgi:hypothetical protein